MTNGNEFNQKSGLGGVILILLGLVALLGPAFLPTDVVATSSKWLISVFGIVLLVIGVILFILTKLYVKTPANEAFIRTGMGGQKVIIDGGAIFISLFHEIKKVSLETMKLIVGRIGKDSIITKDKLKADLTAEFYIKIPKTPEGVIAAATSLGDSGMNSEAIKTLVEEKLISALRSVGAKSTLNELHEDREKFANSVMDQVTKDLESNGLQLESVTISKLDQSSLSNFDSNNVFDAEGARTVAKITSALNVERNAFEKKAEQEIGAENLETQKVLDKQQVEQAESSSEREKDVKILQSTKDREAEEKAQEERGKSESAKIETDRAIAVKEQEKAKAIETAEVDKNKTVELARIEKEKDVAVKTEEKVKAKEVASVDKEKAIIVKNKEKAEVETEKAQAEAKAAEANQAVITVNQVAEADRKKKVTVVNEEAEAETTKIKENAKADIKAYETTTIATADKEAAENRAEAKTVEAEADLKAKEFEAKGEKAVQMVPVEVEKAKVAVNAEQVEVTGKELKYKAEFSQVSITLETNLAEIDANKEIGIANAKGIADAFANANMNIWGDGSTAQKMMDMFTQGQGTHIKLKALNDGGIESATISNEAKELVTAYLKGQKSAMEVMGAAENVSAEIKSLVNEFVKSGAGNSLAGIGLMIKAFTGQEATDGDIEKVKSLIQSVSEENAK